MDAEAFSEHLDFPRGRGDVPPASFRGTAGGAACGDLVRIDLALDGDRVAAAGFEASGCGAAVAAGSAAVELLQGASVLEAARIGAGAVADEPDHGGAGRHGGAAARGLEAGAGHAVSCKGQVHAHQVAAGGAARGAGERRRGHVAAPPGVLQMLPESLGVHDAECRSTCRASSAGRP